jgi:hypothetical protein
MRPSIDDEPADEDPRRTELASIFAAAILRLRRRVVFDEQPPRNAVATCLEVPTETVLSGHHG